AGEGGEERPAHVEVQRVAELVLLGRPRGLDAGGEVTRVVAPEGRLAERPQQVAQRLVAEKVDPFLGQLELDRRAGRAPASPAALGGIVEGHALGGLEIALADEA